MDQQHQASEDSLVNKISHVLTALVIRLSGVDCDLERTIQPDIERRLRSMIVGVAKGLCESEETINANKAVIGNNEVHRLPMDVEATRLNLAAANSLNEGDDNKKILYVLELGNRENAVMAWISMDKNDALVLSEKLAVAVETLSPSTRRVH